MTDGSDVVSAAVAAARAGDLDRLRVLVDWPLTGAGQIAQSLPGVQEDDRADVTEIGLAELDSAATDSGIVEDLLEIFAVRLAGARIEPAGAEAVDEVLAALAVPVPPPGLTPAQEARLAALSVRVAALREAYVVVHAEGELLVAVAPDSGLLALVLDGLE